MSSLVSTEEGEQLRKRKALTSSSASIRRASTKKRAALLPLWPGKGKEIGL